MSDDNAAETRLRALHRAHARTLLAYALRRVEDPADAADVVAETFLVAWRRIDDVPAGEEAKLWLYGVARRVLANQRRSGRRRTGLADRLRQHVAAHAPVAVPADVTTALVVQAAMDRLADDDRELLRLTSWEGLAPAELATVLGRPAPTVRSRLHRARARLRGHLEDLGWDDERWSPAGHVHVDERPLVRFPEDER